MPSLEVVEIVQETNVMDCDDDNDRTVEMTEEPASTAPNTKEKADLSSNEEPPKQVKVGVPITATSTKPTAPSKKSSSKERRVTPTDESLSKKQQQQKKVNQMTLGSFFFGAKKQTSSPVSKPVTAGTKRKQPSPVKSPEKDATSTKAEVEILEAKATTGTSTKTSAREDKKKEQKDKSPASPRKESKEVMGAPQSPSTNDNDTVDLTNDAPDTNAKELDYNTNNRDIDAPSGPIAPEEKPEKESSSNGSSANRASTSDDKSSTHPIVIDSSEESDAKTVSAEELPEERKALLQKNKDMATRYSRRAEELVLEARGGLDDEDFTLPEPQPVEEESASDQEFSDSVLANMALLIEGSALPLSKLVIKISEKLEECHKKQWPVESINTKIKLLSKRKSHLDIPSPSKSIDLFEDEHEDRMWRWEIVMLDLLPSSVLPKVRKARSARRKVSSHYTATNKLIKSVQDAELFILDTKLPQLDTVLAKISRDEEKVLKYERETEKQRITLQAKKRKEQELESKRREKELLAEEKLHKKQEAEQKKLDKEKEKQEVLQARDEAKRKKIGERENRENQKKQKQQEEEQKIERLNKQKAMMMSFLAAPQKQKSKPAVESNKDAKTSDQATESSDISVSSDSFDLDKFRSKIDSLDSHGPKASLFKRLSSDATKSRKRRTCQVPLSIYVTVMPENANAFDAQPFAEQRIVHFPNKYSFRSFHEDCRPAYHGTWSKKSSIVTGRNPFGKDTTYLDYEYDSEGEWEEGDDDMGEDIEDDTKNQEEEEEEGDVKVYDYDDGFCVADDQYLDTDDDVDEETKVLYKKKLQSGGGDPAIVANRVCILAPAPGGVPLGESNLANANLIQGFDKQVGFNLLSSYRGKQLLNENIWLDAFPPAMVDEVEVPADAAAQPGDTSANKDEYAVEEMRSLAIFAHHNALNSKEKLIEELRNAHPDIFVSRAKAIRKLDSIAVKQKHPSAPGVYWEVKTEVLEELALKDVLAKKLPSEDLKSATDACKKDASASKDVKKASKPQFSKKNCKKRKNLDSTSALEPKAKKAKADSPKVSATQASKKSPEKSPTKSPAMAASANMLASFLIKPKKKTHMESTKEKTAVAPAK